MQQNKMKPRLRGIKSKAQKAQKHALKMRARVMPGEAGILEDTPPRITNETVAAHREEVLGSARKYIYPLQHSRHSIVKISSAIFGAAILVFVIFCLLAFYKFQSEGSFVYDVSRVVPFPIAKAGPSYVAYENYLFELRHYIHYYQTQQKLDITSTSGKQQLASFKKQALQQVIDAAYVKQLATKNHVTVSDGEVDDEISLVRAQNRLGSSDQVLSDVLRQFWGWSIDDFRRELKQQLLAQKVVSVLDTNTHARAESALAQLQQGTDFAKLATAVSDDTNTKATGGQYSAAIDRQNRDVQPQIVAALYRLQNPGQVSSIVNTGSTLELVKYVQATTDKRQAAHIQFNFKPISTYLNPLKTQEATHRYITFK
jgi:parvulin-like peptidyl-prolyl isomerase